MTRKRKTWGLRPGRVVALRRPENPKMRRGYALVIFFKSFSACPYVIAASLQPLLFLLQALHYLLRYELIGLALPQSVTLYVPPLFGSILTLFMYQGPFKCESVL